MCLPICDMMVALPRAGLRFLSNGEFESYFQFQYFCVFYDYINDIKSFLTLNLS